MMLNILTSLTVVCGVFAVKTVNDKTVSIALVLKEGTQLGTVVCMMSPGITPFHVQNPLGINNSSLILYKRLDYEQQRHHIINLTISIGSSLKTLPLLIRVENEFDEPPKIHMLYEACRLPEELPPGTDVGTMFRITDRDVDDVLVYSLKGNYSEYLNIHPRTGRITIRQKINRDGESGIVVLYHLEVKVTDRGNNFDEKELVIEIVDVDDNPPRFEEAQYVFYVHPMSKESTIGKLRCSDADVQRYNRKPCNMSIVYGNTDGIFNIKYTVLYARVEDMKEKGSTHVLLVKADNSTDGSNFVTVVVMVQSQDQSRKDAVKESQSKLPPKFVRPVVRKGRFRTVKVPEDTAPGTVVLDVAAKIQGQDQDQGEVQGQGQDQGQGESEAGQVIFSFMPYTSKSAKRKPNLAAVYFKMDPLSGNLTVAKPLDSDKRTGGTKVFSIIIIARGHGHEPKMTRARGKIVLVNVNDNAPVMDKSLYKRTVTCGGDVKDGLLVIKVKDLDNDIVNTVTVDRNSSRRYSVHKKGRDYVLRLHSNVDVRNLSDSVDVITVISSDRKFLAKAKAMIIYTPCEPNITTTTYRSTSTRLTTSLQTTVTSIIPSTSSVVDASTSPTTETDVSSEDVMMTSHVVSDNPMTLMTICQTFSEEESTTTIYTTPTTAKPDVTSATFSSRKSKVSTTTSDNVDVTTSSTSTLMPCTCKTCRRSCKTRKNESREKEEPCLTGAQNGTSSVAGTIVIATGATVASVTTVTLSALLVKKFVLNKSRISSTSDESQ